MRRSDLTRMLRSRAWEFVLRVAFVLSVAGAIVCFAYVLYGCTRTFVPSGKPGCPERQRWSDSAQRCIPRDGAR